MQLYHFWKNLLAILLKKQFKQGRTDMFIFYHDEIEMDGWFLCSFVIEWSTWVSVYLLKKNVNPDLRLCFFVALVFFIIEPVLCYSTASHSPFTEKSRSRWERRRIRVCIMVIIKFSLEIRHLLCNNNLA